MADKMQLGTITILIKDRHSHAKDVNDLLTKNGHIIMARLGVNVQKSCVKNCTGMITIAVEGTTKQINDLTKKIDSLYGIVAQSSIVTN